MPSKSVVNEILQGNSLDVLKTLSDGVFNTCVTSPPYWGLRDYGVDGQLGLEPTPEQYVQRMVELFREVRRTLRDDGTLWLNLGDSYAGAMSHRKLRESGLKPKDLVGIPWMVAFALRADGWHLRSDIIWHKPNPMPESVRDRPTKAHEYIFLLSKSEKYYYNHEAIKEDSKRPGAQGTFGGQKGREYTPEKGDPNYRGGHDQWGRTMTTSEKKNKRSVWSVPTRPFKGAHFATFPPDLIEPCILAGCPEGGLVLDPFFGSGTTGMKAAELGRNFTGIELNPEYIEIAKNRINGTQRKFI